MFNVIRDLTPDELKCGPVLGCPAVYELDDGSILVVGKAVQLNDLPLSVRGRIGEGEGPVIVSKKLLGIKE